MWLSDTAIRRPVLATVISVLLVAFGVLSFTKLPLRELPDVDPPIVSVQTDYLGASAAVVETRITKVLEDRISGIDGIRTVESSSRDGASRINIEFELSRDIENAANDVRDRVSQVLDRLPDEADPPQIYKTDSDSQPIIWLNLSSDRLDQLQLTDYAERYLIDRFAVLDGLARVRLSGERRYAMRIWVDRVALAARELTVLDLERALRTQNVELPAGRIESVSRDFTVRVARGYRTAEDFSNLVLARGDDGHLIRLGEVATVEVGPEEWRSQFHGNGKPRIGLGMVKQSGANTMAVATAIKREAAQIHSSLPEGMTLSRSWDGSTFVAAAVKEVYLTLFLAVLLVVGVIYLFLGTKRAAIIPALTVPICLISTFSALFAFGLSINLLTLLAIVLSIGLVVDDSIVVLENVQRRIEMGEPTLVAAYRGAREVGFAVIATTLVVIAVFVPIAFLEGMTGRLFRELAITVSAAVAFSSLIALTLSAMLCSKLLISSKRDGGLTQTTQRLFAWLQKRYGRALEACLNHSLYVGLALAAVFGSILLLFMRIPSELEPGEDRGGFLVQMIGPEGASFDDSLRHMQILEDRVLFPLIESGDASHVLTKVPGGFGAGASMSTGFVIVVLAPWDERERSAIEIIHAIRSEGGKIPGIHVMAFPPGGLGRRGSGQPVQFVIGGATHEEIGAWQERLLARISEVPGLTRVQGDFKPTKPQLRVEIDHARAAELGVSVETIGRTLETMLGSRKVTTYVERGEEYDVIVQAKGSQRATAGDLSNIYARSDRTGELIPLSNLVSTREVAEPGVLRRFNRLPAATLSASIAEGAVLGDALDALERLARDALPSSAHFDYKGISREFRESSLAAYFTFGLALLIVYLVLAAQFESFVHPVVIMLSVPLAIFGALAGLALVNAGAEMGFWAMRGTINIYSQIGMTILIGIAAKNGILIVEFANQLRKEGLEFRAAILEAAQTRLRPILMTGLSTAIGVLPLLLGQGPGSGGRNSIGVVVFSGVMFATTFTIFVVPVFYAVLAKRTQLPGAVEQRLALQEREAPNASRI
jgi:multidrug efflux pump